MDTISNNGVSRRSFVKKGAFGAAALALLTLEGPAFALGKELAAQANGDLDIANFQYGLEALAIKAYQTAAGTNLLDKDTLAVALKFVDQHSQHQKAWEAEVNRLGGKPQALEITKYPDLKTATDIVGFAKTLEEVAVGSYYIALGKFEDASRKTIAGSIMPIELEHATVLGAALKQDPIPSSFPIGKSQDEINTIATALGVAPVAAPPPATPAPTQPPAQPTPPATTAPVMPGAPPSTGAGGSQTGSDDNSGIVVATLAAISAAAAGAIALGRSKNAKSADKE